MRGLPQKGFLCCINTSARTLPLALASKMRDQLIAFVIRAASYQMSCLNRDDGLVAGHLGVGKGSLVQILTPGSHSKEWADKELANIPKTFFDA